MRNTQWRRVSVNPTLCGGKYELKIKDASCTNNILQNFFIQLSPDIHSFYSKEPEGFHYEGNERFEGYVVDLIYDLAEECNFDVVFQPVPDNNYGSYDKITDEWNGIIRELMDNVSNR